MDIKTVEKIAKLSRISITPQEAESLTKEIGGILKWVEQLAEVNTDAIADAGEGERKQRLRKDEITDGNCKDKVLLNAPDAQFDCYAVPKVIE